MVHRRDHRMMVDLMNQSCLILLLVTISYIEGNVINGRPETSAFSSPPMDNSTPIRNAYPGANGESVSHDTSSSVVVPKPPDALEQSAAPRHQCSVDDYVKRMSLSDFETVLERFAKSEHISVFAVLRELYSMLYASAKRRGQLKDASSTLRLEAMALQELCMNSALTIAKARGQAAASHPHHAVAADQYDFGDAFPLFVPPSKMLRPPPGAKIVVEGSPNDVQFPDVYITVSPQMSVVEALRKASYKYQAETPNDNDNLITMGFSTALSCYALSSVGSTSLNDANGWEISVLDPAGQLVYRNFCLPPRDELVVRPRTTIVLTYTSLPSISPSLR